MPRLPHRRSVPQLVLRLLLLFQVALYARSVAAEPACPTVLPNPPDPRIVGGLPAPPQLAVFLAALFNQRSFFRCTATILAPGWLLTARHCNVSADWTAILSTADRNIGSPQQIAEVIAHPTPGERHDLTLIRLAGNSTALPVPPLLLNADSSAPRVASFARTAGYGRRDYDDARNTRLRQVDVPIVDETACDSAYGAATVDSRVCAGYSAGGCDSCVGDSGGPLLQYDAQLRPVLMAVVSAGKNCALPGFPGLYAPIHPVLGWLREHDIPFDTGTPSDSPGAAGSDSVAVETPSPSPSSSPSPSPSLLPGASQTATDAAGGSASSVSGDTDDGVVALPPGSEQDSDVNVSGTEDTEISGDGDGDAVVSGTGDGSEAASGTGADDPAGGSAEGGGTEAVSAEDGAVSAEDAAAAPAAAATASPSADDAEAARQNSKGGLSGGSVAGIAVAGVAVGVVLIVASVCYVMMPRRTDAAVAV